MVDEVLDQRMRGLDHPIRDLLGPEMSQHLTSLNPDYKVVNDFGLTLGILPYLVRNKEAPVPNAPEHFPTRVDSVAQLVVIDKVKLQIFERAVILGAPYLEMGWVSTEL